MPPLARPVEPLRLRLAEAGLALLLALGPLALGGTAPLLLWALVLVSAFAIAASYADGEPLRPGPLAGVFGLSAIACLLQLVPLPGPLLAALSPAAAQTRAVLGLSPSGPISLDPPATARELAKFLGYLAAFFAAGKVATSRRARTRLFGAIAATGALCAVIGLGHLLVGADALFGVVHFSPPPPPLLTPFGNPNHLAGLLGLSASLAVGLALSTGRPTRAYLWAIAAVLCEVGLFLSLSRGGIVCALLGQLLLAGLGAARPGRGGGARPRAPAAPARPRCGGGARARRRGARRRLARVRADLGRALDGARRGGRRRPEVRALAGPRPRHGGVLSQRARAGRVRDRVRALPDAHPVRRVHPRREPAVPARGRARRAARARGARPRRLGTLAARAPVRPLAARALRARRGARAVPPEPRRLQPRAARARALGRGGARGARARGAAAVRPRPPRPPPARPGGRRARRRAARARRRPLDARRRRAGAHRGDREGHRSRGARGDRAAAARAAPRGSRARGRARPREPERPPRAGARVRRSGALAAPVRPRVAPDRRRRARPARPPRPGTHRVPARVRGQRSRGVRGGPRARPRPRRARGAAHRAEGRAPPARGTTRRARPGAGSGRAARGAAAARRRRRRAGRALAVARAAPGEDGSAPEAREALAEAEAAGAPAVDAGMVRASIQWAEGKQEESSATLAALRAAHPQSGEVAIELGSQLLARGKRHDAREVLEQARRTVEEPSMRARLLALEAGSYEQEEKWASALELYRTCARLEPRAPGRHYDVARMLERLHLDADALTELEEGLRFDRSAGRADVERRARALEQALGDRLGEADVAGATAPERGRRFTLLHRPRMEAERCGPQSLPVVIPTRRNRRDPPAFVRRSPAAVRSSLGPRLAPPPPPSPPRAPLALGGSRDARRLRVAARARRPRALRLRAVRGGRGPPRGGRAVPARPRGALRPRDARRPRRLRRTLGRRAWARARTGTGLGRAPARGACPPARRLRARRVARALGRVRRDGPAHREGERDRGSGRRRGALRAGGAARARARPGEDRRGAEADAARDLRPRAAGPRRGGGAGRVRACRRSAAGSWPGSRARPTRW